MMAQTLSRRLASSCSLSKERRNSIIIAFLRVKILICHKFYNDLSLSRYSMPFSCLKFGIIISPTKEFTQTEDGQRTSFVPSVSLTKNSHQPFGDDSIEHVFYCEKNFLTDKKKNPCDCHHSQSQGS